MTDVGNDFDRRFAERADQRRDDRLARASERMDAGAFVPRELAAAVEAWRKETGGRRTAGDRTSGAPEPRDVGVRDRGPQPAAAPGTTGPGVEREVVTELRAIRSWLSSATLGIS